MGLLIRLILASVEIENYYKGKVKILDSTEIVAQKVKEKLKASHLLNKGKSSRHRFYVSDYTKSFEQSTRLFFSGNIKLELLNIWKAF